MNISLLRLLCPVLILSTLGLRAADVYKLNVNSALNVTTAWSTGVLPGPTETVVWDSRITTAGNCTNNLGQNFTWQGIRIANPVVPVAFTNGTTLRTLTLNSGGIVMNSSTSTMNFTINCQLVVGEAQAWEVGPGRILAFGTNAGNPALVTMNADLTPRGTLRIGRAFDVNSNSVLTIADGTAFEFMTNAESVLRVGNNALGGTVNQSGGTVRMARSGTTRNVLNVGNAALNPGALGLYNLSGGLLDADDAADYLISIANVANAPGVLNVSGSGQLLAGQVNVGLRTNGTLSIRENGFMQARGRLQLAGVSGGQIGFGTVDLSGGTLVLTNITRGAGSGTAIVNFNGGLLRPLASNNNFVDSAGNPAVPIVLQVQAGGARIDTAGASVGISHGLVHDGVSPDGGLTKLGAGTLTLTGTNTYDGDTLVSAGRLLVPASCPQASPFTIAHEATLGVSVGAAGDTLRLGTLTLGQGAGEVVTNEINLGPYGSPVTPVIHATNLAVNGTVAVAVSGLGLSLGQFPLYRYDTASGVGAGTFVLASLPAGVSATLVHNAGNRTIDLVITAAPSLVWMGLTDGNWDLLTANWVDDVSGLAATYFNGAAVRFDDNAFQTVVQLTAAHAPGRIAVSNAVLAYQFTGPGSLGGGGVLIKDGPGALTLGTSNNAYAGDTDIRAGSVVLGATNAIPDGAGRGNLLLNGRLDLAGFAEAVNGLSGSGVVENTASTPVTLGVGNNNASGAFTGQITETAGAIALSKAGNGTILLGSANTYSGGSTSLGGLLRFGHDQSLGSGLVELRGGGLATAGGRRTLANPVSITAGAPAFDTSEGDLVLNGPLTDTGAFDPNKNGDNALVIRGGQYFAAGGGFNVNQGQLILDGCSATNLDDGVRLQAASGKLVSFVLTNGAVFSVGAAGTGSPNLRLGFATLSASTNVLHLSSGEVVMEGSARELMVGEMGGTIGVVRQTGGTFRWRNNNSTNIGVLLGSNNLAQGTYELAGGTLVAPRVRRGAGTAYFHFDGGTLSASTNVFAASFMAGLTACTIGNGGAGIDSAGANVTVGQSLLAAGLGGLTKLGAGTLTLAGTNTYTGPTVIEEGVVSATPAVFAGGGEIVVRNFGGLRVTLAAPGTSLAAKGLHFDSIDATLDLQLASFGNPTVPVIEATNLSLTGFCVIHVGGANLVPGQFPLIRYAGTVGGGGVSRFSLGNLPLGLQATLVDNAANKTVDLLVISVAALAWSGATDANWDTNGTINWDFLGIPLGYTDGTSVRFDDAAWAFTSVNLTVPLFPGSVTVSNDILPNYTFGGPGRLSGTASLVKQGAGSLVLSNDNDFTGPVTISGGTLVAGSSNALGSAVAGTTIRDGGTLDVFANMLNRERLTVSGAGVGGQGALVNNGAAQQQNATRLVTLAGDTTLGAVQRWDIRAASGTTNAELSTGGQPHRLTKVGSNHIALVSVQIDPALGELDIQEGGFGYELNTTSLGDPSRPATIRSNAWLRMYQATHPLTKAVRLEEAGQLIGTSGTSNVVTGPIVVPGGLGQIGASSGATLTVSNGITGAGGLRKVQPGTTTLAVPNTYAGPTLIEAGALSVTADDRLGQAGADVILNGGILLAADGFTLGSVRDLWLGYGADGTGTVQVASNTLTYAGVVADYPGGVGTLSKTGAGTLLLEGANTFSGAAFVQAGTLALGHDNAAGAGWVRLGAGTLATAGGARTLTNTVAVNAIGTFDTSAGDLILMGALTNNSTGDPRKAGEGSLVLRGGMTFAGGAGWDILRGLMVMDGSAGVVADDGYRISAEDGVLAGLVLTNGGSLTLGTSGGTPNLRLGNTSTTGTNVVVVAGGDLAFGERAVELILTYAANTTNLVRQSAGTVRWTGTNVAAGINMAFAAGGYSVYQLDGGLLSVPRIRQTAATGNGWFHFNGGTVSPSTNLNASTFMVGLTAALVQDGGAHFDTAGLDITVGQALLNGGSGGLAKSGAGRLTLTNVSTYVGPTRVLGGTLALTGSGSVASSTLLTISSGAVLDVAGVTGGFPLAAGQTLGGGGAVAGVVQVNPGATVAPGDGLGVLTLSNAPILNGTVDLQVRRSGGSLSSDTLVVFGTLSFGGELRVTVASGSDALQNGDVFNLFDAGAFAGTFASFNLPALPAGLEWDGSQLGVDGTLRVAASAGGGNRVAVADLSDGTLRLTYEGTPGTAYALERATNLGASALWVPLSTNVVPGSGLLLFTNTPLPPATFYRTRRVP